MVVWFLWEEDDVDTRSMTEYLKGFFLDKIFDEILELHRNNKQYDLEVYSP